MGCQAQPESHFPSFTTHLKEYGGRVQQGRGIATYQSPRVALWHPSGMVTGTSQLWLHNAMGSLLPGVFGFAQAGEFPCLSLDAFAPDMLSPRDIALDSHNPPTYLIVHLKKSKMDLFGVRMTLYLGLTGDILCPVTAVLGFLAIHLSSPGLFSCSRMAQHCLGQGLSRHYASECGPTRLTN